MDAHVRDNFNASGPHLLVRKTADETVTSNTVVQNDDVLFFAVAANEVWYFRMILLWTGTTGFDMKYTFTWPSGTANVTTIWPLTGVANPGTIQTITTSGTTSTLDVMVSTTTQLTPFEGLIANGGSAGNMQFQWAQETSSVNSVVVKSNSTLWGVKVA